MNFLRAFVIVSTLGVVLSALVGCREERSRTARAPSGSSGLQQSERGDVLFSAVVGQLRNLVGQVDTDLTPPAVILDSKSSANGKDVMAVCTTNPDYPDGPINYLSVWGEPNSRFRSLGVRPGDILKFYAVYDAESLETGIQQTVAMDLLVAQVLNDNALLIQGGLTRPVLEPAKVEVWRYLDDRLDEIARQLGTYVRYRRPVFDWEPTPDARILKQVVERLNQWMRQSQPKVDWSLDPLLATLDPQLANDDRLAPLIAESALAAPVFEPYEGRRIQEAIWHRDISRWAQGRSLYPVERAAALFDWTVRNVQLDADEDALPLRPWQVLMFGHGTAEQRAWVFAELCRQQGLEIVILSIPDEAELEAGDEAATGAAKFWLPALLSDGQLYLFDTRLGLAIPGAKSEGVATLAAVLADENLLRQLDLDDRPYDVTAEQLQHVTASPVADRFQLTRRAQAIEGKLTGDDRLVLTARPSTVVERLKDAPGVAEVKIWDFPFEILRDQLRVPMAQRRRLAMDFEPFAWRPTLWKARVLHFRGQRAEPSADDPTADVADDHGEAVQIYTSRLVRPPDRVINNLGSAPKQRIYSAAKDGASYWVGLLLFEDEKFPSAESWLQDPRLSAGDNNPWYSGTRYNLARTLEAQGKLAEAIALYEADTSPQAHGNRLRGKWLQESAPTTEKSSPDADE
jgi:hypothetical protein